MKALFLLLSLGISFCSFTALAKPARVLIIRHGEKPLDDKNYDLSAQGYARAQALVDLFSIHPEYAQPALPVAYYATGYIEGKSSARPVETITPLAQRYQKTVLQNIFKDHEDELAREILNNPDYDNQVVMIAWVHQNIPALVKAFGAGGPDQWDGEEVYDRVWILDFMTDGTITFADRPQNVLPTDSAQ